MCRNIVGGGHYNEWMREIQYIRKITFEDHSHTKE